MVNPKSMENLSRNGGRRRGSGRKKKLSTIAKEVLQEVSEKSALEALEFLRGVVNNPQASWGVRSATAQYLVDRCLGKPKQAVKVDGRMAVSYENFIERA